MSGRRYRRNPGDFELLAGLAVAGVVVWGAYEAYKGMSQTAAAVNAGFADAKAALEAFEQSVVNGVTSPFTTFGNWLSGGNAAPGPSTATSFPGFGGGSSTDSSSSSDSSGGGGASF